MSYANRNNIINRVSAADLTAAANLYKAVKSTSDTQVNLAGAGEVALGFLNNQPNTGDVAEINSLGGGSNAISAATLAVGVELSSDANGEMVAAGSNDYVIAISLVASVAGDIFEVLPVLYEKN